MHSQWSNRSCSDTVMHLAHPCTRKLHTHSPCQHAQLGTYTVRPEVVTLPVAPLHSSQQCAPLYGHVAPHLSQGRQNGSA
jgi:hypothetical protein